MIPCPQAGAQGSVTLKERCPLLFPESETFPSLWEKSTPQFLAGLGQLLSKHIQLQGETPSEAGSPTSSTACL